jgi:hypothetical protein
MIAPKVKGGETPQLCGRTFAAAADWEVIFFPYTYRFLFLGGLGKKTTFFSKKVSLALRLGAPVRRFHWAFAAEASCRNEERRCLGGALAKPRDSPLQMAAER